MTFSLSYGYIVELEGEPLTVENIELEEKAEKNEDNFFKRTIARVLPSKIAPTTFVGQLDGTLQQLYFKAGLGSTVAYGQRKLLEIPRALATKSQIFFFDEPFAGLFSEMVDVISNIILELKQKGKTIILIEHNINSIRKLCDHVIALDSGKLLIEGLPAEVLENKKVVEVYLGK